MKFTLKIPVNSFLKIFSVEWREQLQENYYFAVEHLSNEVAAAMLSDMDRIATDYRFTFNDIEIEYTKNRYERHCSQFEDVIMY